MDVSIATGFIFLLEMGANSVLSNLGNSNNNTQTFDNCKFVIGGTSGGNINTSVSIATTYWNNCTVKFAAAGSLMSYGNGVFVWTNSLSAIDAAGTIPTTLFNIGSGSCFYEGVDFSALSGKTLFATASGFNSQNYKRL